jgi:hypothetical protein
MTMNWPAPKKGLLPERRPAAPPYRRASEPRSRHYAILAKLNRWEVGRKNRSARRPTPCRECLAAASRPTENCTQFNQICYVICLSSEVVRSSFRRVMQKGDSDTQ